AVTREPSGSGPAASSTSAEAVTEAETSAILSRKVRNCVGPLRRLISITWASTQISPSLPTQSLTAMTTRPRGCGSSAELFIAMTGTLPAGTDKPVDTLIGMKRAKGPARGWLPNQHGAWAMLVLPWLFGLAHAIGAGRFRIEQVVLFA